MPKTLTREQLESRKEKAERFVRVVLGDPERADEIVDESLEDYADRRKIQLADNPRGGNMAVRVYNPLKKKPVVRKPAVEPVVENRLRRPNALEIQAEAERQQDHLNQLNELQRENEILQDRLDKVVDLAAAPKDEESETADDLKDKLNQIMDVAAPGEVDDPEGDEGEGED